ncbi:MAG: mannonate dehydratase, partial [Firmicutes bacterium]|nr:mannonate dehydratase [Bacillota bacterium]
MQMTFRWYGDGNDSITPEMIRQIPGVSGLVWALHDKQPGEIWERDEIEAVRKRIEGAGFNMDVVESVNVHDDIKVGLPTRDLYIENYKTTLENLAEFGVKVVTYNFMPIFDWTRTDLFHPLPDGSTALYYERAKIQGDYRAMADYILNNLHGMTFPGWEPERMARLDELFEMYRPVTKEMLWDNLKYFLDAIMPTCKATGIKMAI